MLAVLLLLLVTPPFPNIVRGDGSLYLTLDKSVCMLGETVTITISIKNEKCMQHFHIISLEIYDSSLHQMYVFPQEKYRREYGYAPEEFPLTTSYRAALLSWKNEDVHTAFLFVKHFQYGSYSYLEDQKAFAVLRMPQVTVTQSTVLPTITVAWTTIPTMTTSTITQTMMAVAQTLEVDWRLILAISVLTGLISSLEIRRRKGRRSRLHSE